MKILKVNNEVFINMSLVSIVILPSGLRSEGRMYVYGVNGRELCSFAEGTASAEKIIDFLNRGGCVGG